MTQSDDLGDEGGSGPAGRYSPSERAYFAARILPALIADKELRKVFCEDAVDLGTSHYEQAAYHALRHADALIRALQEPMPPHSPPPGTPPVARARSARPPAWDAPHVHPTTFPDTVRVSMSPVTLSPKMISTLTIMARGEPQPVAAAQAKFFERHGLAVAATGLPAPRKPYRMMNITPLGHSTLLAAYRSDPA